MEVQPGVVEAHPGAVVTYLGVMEAHPGANGAYPGDVEAHPVAMELTIAPVSVGAV
jgi:hypothetical protein